MNIKRFLLDRHSYELLPLLFVIFLLPFFNGGESNQAKIIFLAFPLLYLPLFFLRKRTLNPALVKIFVAWVVFLIVSLVSTIFSISLTLSAPKLFEFLGVFLYFVFFSLVVDRTSDLKVFSVFLIAVGFLLSLVSIVFVFSPPGSLPPMNLLYARYGHNHLADYLLVVLPVVMVLFISSRRASRTFVHGLLLAFLCLAFYLTFARAAFVIVALMTLFLLVFYRPPLLKTACLSFLGFLPFILLLTSFLVSASLSGQRLSSSPQAKGDWFLRQMIKPLSTEPRPEYWHHAIQGFVSRPLLGNGPGTFRLTSRRFQLDPTISSWFAHNSFLQNASELGLLGCLAFGALLLLVSFSLFRATRQSVFFIPTSFALINLIMRARNKFRRSHRPDNSSGKNTNEHVRIMTVPFATKKFSLRDLKNNTKLVIPLLLGVSGSLLQSFLDYNFDFLAIFLLFWSILAILLKLSPERSGLNSHFPAWPVFLISMLCFGFAISSSLSLLFLSSGKRAERKSFNQAFIFYRNSALLPSVDAGRFQRFLQFANLHQLQTEVTSLEPYILLWNREDPEIYRLLVESRSSKEEISPLLSRMLLFVSPFEKFRLMSYLLPMRKADSDLTFTYFLDALFELNYLTADDQEFLAASPYRDVLLKHLSRFYVSGISTRLQIKRLAAKTFYFTGLEILEQGTVEDAGRFWEWARLYSMDLDYFQIEAAAFSFHVKKDETQARAILTACLNNPYPRDSCQHQLDMPLTYLPIPGSLRNRVEELSINE